MVLPYPLFLHYFSPNCPLPLPGGLSNYVILYATKYPEDIESILILSPFISGFMQTDQIINAGGIEKWENCPFIGWDHACNVWKDLKEYASNPEGRDNIFLERVKKVIWHQGDEPSNRSLQLGSSFR